LFFKNHSKVDLHVKKVEDQKLDARSVSPFKTSPVLESMKVKSAVQFANP
jgi:hypothetical protein